MAQSGRDLVLHPAEKVPILRKKSLSKASFTYVEQLRQHMDHFIEAYNDNPRPFAWTKAKVRQRPLKALVLNSLHL